jgi:hypothetical protein
MDSLVHFRITKFSMAWTLNLNDYPQFKILTRPVRKLTAAVLAGPSQ